jgi:hypothetical protein
MIKAPEWWVNLDQGGFRDAPEMIRAPAVVL